MTIQAWFGLVGEGRRRGVHVGTDRSAALVGLDLEGRVFAYDRGELVADFTFGDPA